MMLKVTGIHRDVTSETIETDDYVFSIFWNNFSSGENKWWMIRSGQMTLMELAAKGSTNFIHHICLVTIQPDWISIQDDICLNLGVPEERGLPVCEWEDQTGDSPQYAHKSAELRLCIGSEGILIQFMPQTQIVRFITTDRVRFGIDFDNHITAIQVTQLTLDEIEAVKSTFVT
jgi:hypothetical protein